MEPLKALPPTLCLVARGGPGSGPGPSQERLWRASVYPAGRWKGSGTHISWPGKGRALLRGPGVGGPLGLSIMHPVCGPRVLGPDLPLLTGPALCCGGGRGNMAPQGLCRPAAEQEGRGVLRTFPSSWGSSGCAGPASPHQAAAVYPEAIGPQSAQGGWGGRHTLAG